VSGPALTRGRPRAAYPRPQLRRPAWRCLNGVWDFAFDDAAPLLRRAAAPAAPPGGAWQRKIAVPFPYQSVLSGIGEREIHPVLWYRRRFTVPAAWRRRRLRLHFGAVDYRADVWLNGRRLDGGPGGPGGPDGGAHEGGYTPFAFDVGAVVRRGENELVVRAEDPPDGDQPCGKQDRSVHRPYRFVATSGIWQSVWLEPVGDAPDGAYLRGCRIVPDPDLGGFRLTPDVAGDAAGLRFTAAADYAGAPQGAVEAAPDAVAAPLPLRQCHLWSPDAPRLYDLTLRLLRGDAVVDEVTAYAGLRQVTVQGREIRLNGEPLYQRLVLDQGYWPDGLYTAPDDAALRADVAWAKRLGFNGARKHQKVEDPRWLYWCDRLGLLVWTEMAAFWEDTALSRERLRREWQEVVRRDVNHPCVVAWVPFNESMGLRDLDTDGGAQAYVAAVVADTRAIDATRPVVDNSGWSHVDTDIADSHHYEPEAGLFLGAWEAFHRPGAPEHHRLLRSWNGQHEGRTWYGPGYRRPFFAGDRAYRGQPIVVSEWGGFFLDGADPAATPVAPVLAQRRGVAPDGAAFLARYASMIAAFDSLPDLAGDCWTQLTDIEDEPNGLLTEDRTPKLDPERVRALNRAGVRGRRPRDAVPRAATRPPPGPRAGRPGGRGASPRSGARPRRGRRRRWPGGRPLGSGPASPRRRGGSPARRPPAGGAA
jgi:hypothetical protein